MSSETIVRLRALIDHPATGAEERATAQRMLARALARSPRDAGDVRRGGRLGRHAGVEEVADAIRIDIALARVSRFGEGVGVERRDPVRQAPDGVTFAVTVESGAAIVVTIDGVPRHWGWTSDGPIDTVSPALQELAEHLAAVVDIHAGTRFFRRIRVPEQTLVW